MVWKENMDLINIDQKERKHLGLQSAPSQGSMMEIKS
jgi:hypothetical protein